MERDETGTLKKKLRNARIWISFLVILIFLAFVYAFYQQTVAKKEAERARIAEVDALQQRDAATAAEKLAQQEKERADEQAQIALENARIAKENEIAANEARKDAEEKKVLAEKAEARAVAQQKIAEEQRRIADRNAEAARGAQELLKKCQSKK